MTNKARKTAKKAPKKRKTAKKAGKTAGNARKTAKNARKTAKNGEETPTEAAKRLAAHFGVKISRQQVYAWRKAGLDLSDPEELRKTLETRRNQPAALANLVGKPAGDADGPSLREELLLEQIRKTRAEASLKELQEAEMRADLVPKREVLEDGIQLGALMKSFLLKIPETWPPMIEGLPAAKMRPRLRAEVQKLMEEWHAVTAEKLES